jgi:hypothetical protein
MTALARIRPPRRGRLVGLLFLALAFPSALLADSSSPRLAAYYDGYMALCGGTAYAWRGTGTPRPALPGVRAVGVGKGNFYALSKDDVLLAWDDDPAAAQRVIDRVASFHAGRSGLLVIRDDASLWHLETASILGFGEALSERPVQVAENVVSAAVGDGADYYVTRDGRLFVRGKAHRGQYGDGRLTSTAQFVATAGDAVQVVAHTGHALYLATDGTVYGTGGNIYGPRGASSSTGPRPSRRAAATRSPSAATAAPGRGVTTTGSCRGRCSAARPPWRPATTAASRWRRGSSGSGRRVPGHAHCWRVPGNRWMEETDLVVGDATTHRVPLDDDFGNRTGQLQGI